MPKGTKPTRAIVQCARELRQDETEAERLLWENLRGRRFHGLKFRRQHPIGRFVADFYCPALKLVIEVDGDVHDEFAVHRRDLERTTWLHEAGLRVIRIPNDEVMSDLPAALRRIAVAIGVAPVSSSH